MDSRVYILGRDSVPAELHLGADQKADLCFVALPGTSASVELTVFLEGEGASLELVGAYFCPGAENLNLNVNVRHLACGCSSHQVLRGIVGGEARASFSGLVYVAHGAQQTKAMQESHAILLSSKAVANAQPQLEIYADDVECSHGATCGSLNEDEQFYMRSRGIPEQEARKLQMISFLSPVLGRIPESVAEELTSLLK